jgi:ABC-type multidrug transport system fused ATPase/permease subunit
MEKHWKKMYTLENNLRVLVILQVTLRASSRMHDKVFRKILRSPMSFFDVTPVGRLLNRFSKDLDEGD